MFSFFYKPLSVRRRCCFYYEIVRSERCCGSLFTKRNTTNRETAFKCHFAIRFNFIFDIELANKAFFVLSHSFPCFVPFHSHTQTIPLITLLCIIQRNALNNGIKLSFVSNMPHFLHPSYSIETFEWLVIHWQRHTISRFLQNIYFPMENFIEKIISFFNRMDAFVNF